MSPSNQSSRLQKTVTRRLFVQGKVQGVGFRRFCTNHAKRLGLQGWAANLPDGRVEVVATGPVHALRKFIRRIRRGSAASTVESVEVRRSKVLQFHGFEIRKPVSTEQDIPPEAIHFAPELRLACQRAYDHLPADRRVANRFEQRNRTWRFDQFPLAAAANGFVLKRLGRHSLPTYVIDTGSTLFGLDVTRPSWVEPVTAMASNDKRITKAALIAAGVPVAKGGATHSLEEGLRLFEHAGRNVAVKPAYGSDSAGVTTHVTTLPDFHEAWQRALSASAKGQVIVEEYVPGADLRILMAGDHVVVAYLRLHAHVIGDGVSPIRDLIIRKNKDRITLPGAQVSHLIQQGDFEQQMLDAQQVTMESIPADGELVLLGQRPNFTDGADMVPVTDLLHPDIIGICQDTARALGPSAFWGLDIIAEDFTRSASEAKVIICETNSRPAGGVLRYATHGEHVFFVKNATALADELAPARPKPTSDDNTFLVAQGVDGASPVVVKDFGSERLEAVRAFEDLRAQSGPFPQIALSDTADGPQPLHLDLPPQAAKPGAQPDRKATARVFQTLLDTTRLDYDLFEVDGLTKMSGDVRQIKLPLRNSSFIWSALAPHHSLGLRDIMARGNIPLLPIFPLDPKMSWRGPVDRLHGQVHLCQPGKRDELLPFDRFENLEENLRERLAAVPGSIAGLSHWERADLEALVISGTPAHFGLRTASGCLPLPHVPASLANLAQRCIDALPGFCFGRIRFAQDREGSWFWHSLSEHINLMDYLNEEGLLPPELQSTLEAAVQTSATITLAG